MSEKKTVLEEVQTSFKGFPGVDRNYVINELKMTGHTPDCAGAVGMSYFVQLINGAFVIYNKREGTQFDKPVTDKHFWSSAGLSSDNPIDPRILFVPNAGDYGKGQFIAAQVNNHYDVMLATSNPANPDMVMLNNWKGVKIEFPGVRPDFTRLGYDNDGVYVVVTDMDPQSAHSGGSCIAYIPRPQAFKWPLDVCNITILPAMGRDQVGETLFPVISGASSKFAYFIGADTSSDPRRNLTFALMQKSPSPVIVSMGKIPVEPYTEAKRAHQPLDTAYATIIAGGQGIPSAPYFDGKYIWVTHAISINDYCAVRWYRLFINNYNSMPILDAWGEIKDESQYVHYDFFNPSIIALPGTDRAVIAMTRSGDSATGASGNAGSYAAVVELKNGKWTTEVVELWKGEHGQFLTAPSQRWGDYSTIMADPDTANRPRTFWLTNEYAKGATNFGTMFGSVILAPTED